MIGISNGGKPILEQILVSEERKKSKRADPSRKVNHLSKVFEIDKLIAEFTKSVSSTRIGKPVLMMGV